MCSGHTTHIVNGKEIKLEQGNLMFLNQSVTHEILEAEQQDIAVNFIVLPEFFNNVLSLVGEEETPIRRFFGRLSLRAEQWNGLFAFRGCGKYTNLESDRESADHFASGISS